MGSPVNSREKKKKTVLSGSIDPKDFHDHHFWTRSCTNPTTIYADSSFCPRGVYGPTILFCIWAFFQFLSKRPICERQRGCEAFFQGFVAHGHVEGDLQQGDGDGFSKSGKMAVNVKRMRMKWIRNIPLLIWCDTVGIQGNGTPKEMQHLLAESSVECAKQPPDSFLWLDEFS